MTTEDNRETIRASLQPLIAQARATGQWLHCYHENLWFAPAELEAAHAAGKFLWGPVNWELRDPREHQAALNKAAESAANAARAFQLRWQGP